MSNSIASLVSSAPLNSLELVAYLSFVLDHSPAPDTSGNGWLSKLTFWRQPKDDGEVVLPSNRFEQNTRSVINLDDPNPSRQNHQSLMVPPVPHAPQNFNLAPPPPSRVNIRPPPPSATRNPLPTPSRRVDDFPQSTQSNGGVMRDEPEPTQLAYGHEGSLPIHHQFLAPDMASSPSPMMDPFGDEQRPRPSRSSFAPPGLTSSTSSNPANASRNLTAQAVHGSLGHSQGRSISQDQWRSHRRTSSVPNANPFSTPFDDPQSPQRQHDYHNHNFGGNHAPATPSAFSTNSGPRAF